MEELDLIVGVTLEDITWENLSGDIQDNKVIEELDRIKIEY